ICVGSDTCHILIDAGISGKKIEEGLNSIDLKTAEMQGVLITHEHMDHIAGLGVLARRYGLPMYATAGTIDAILHTKALGMIDENLFHTIRAGEEFVIGDLSVEAIPISHDAAEPVAYKIKQPNKAVAVITDLGTYDDALVEKLKGLDVLLLEANHDVNMLQVGSYPYRIKQRILGDRGHLSNEVSGQLLGELLHDAFKAVFLGHLSKDNNYPELAYETVRLEVTMGKNPYKGDDFPIYVAGRDRPSQMVRF
ncbi:MAG: MBL fold metallo-hydrolase, partial [Roseburia sp.]